MFATLILVYAVLGIITNLNLAYCLAQTPNGRPWKLSQIINRTFQSGRRRFGRWHYAVQPFLSMIVLISLSVKMENGSEIAVYAAQTFELFLFTTLVLWFFLEAQYKRSLRMPTVPRGGPNADFDGDALNS